jgi:hypothetical protein
MLFGSRPLAGFILIDKFFRRQEKFAEIFVVSFAEKGGIEYYLFTSLSI